MTLLLLIAGLGMGRGLGMADTIGGTTYDMSTICAGLQRMVYYAPGQGVHATWWWSADSSPWPDRNSRYNFYDLNGGIWQWIDEDFVLSGIAPYLQKNSYGSLDYDLSHAQPVYSFHIGPPLQPVAARRTTAGPGSFQFCAAPAGFQWPWVAVTPSGTIHLAMIDEASQDELWYTRTTDFQNWSTPFNIASPAPDPGFPAHQITASKQSARVAVLWVVTSPGTLSARLYLRQSTDDGETWDSPAEIAPPPAYMADTLTSFHISSIGSFYDRDDNLCIIAAVAPVIRDTLQVTPAEIWFYNRTNVPQWNEVHRADVPLSSVRHSVGYNSIFACRPRAGQNPATAELYAVWSEYDTANVEQVTGLLRPDIWVASSADNGRTWSSVTRLTGPDQRGRLYVDLAPIVNDTLHLVWMEDLCVGMSVLGQGPVTRNPVVYLQLPADEIAIKERPSRAKPASFDTGPTVLRRTGTLQTDAGDRMLLDASGRIALQLRAGSNSLQHTKPGIYFLVNRRGAGPAAKLVIQ